MVAGNVADLAFSLQSAKGTPSATSQHRIYLTGGGYGPDRTVADLEETGGVRLRSDAYVQRASAAGEPQAFVRPDWIGLALYGVLGAKAVTGAADPWTHTFTMALTQPWLTFWSMLGGILYQRMPDTKINRLVLESEAGGPLRATIGLVGLTAQSKTAAEVTAAVEIVPPFYHYDGKGQFLVEGAAVASIERSALTIEAGITPQQGDDVVASDATEGMYSVTWETRQVITDVAMWNRLHYGTASPADNAVPTSGVLQLAGAPAGLQFKYTKRDAAGVALTPERSLQLAATRLVVQSLAGFAPNTDGSPLKSTATYRVYQPASGSGITAILKNGKATYPAV